MELNNCNSPEQSTNKEKLMLNINNPKHIINVIGQIEGIGWQNRQEKLLDETLTKDNKALYTVKAAIEALKKFNNYINTLRQELKDEKNDHEKCKLIKKEIKEHEGGYGPKAEIYGDGGCNRYYVLSNGEIAISESHMLDMKRNKCKKLAEELGIRVV